MQGRERLPGHCQEGAEEELEKDNNYFTTKSLYLCSAKTNIQKDSYKDEGAYRGKVKKKRGSHSAGSCTKKGKNKDLSYRQGRPVRGTQSSAQ